MHVARAHGVGVDEVVISINVLILEDYQLCGCLYASLLISQEKETREREQESDNTTDKRERVRPGIR